MYFVENSMKILVGMIFFIILMQMNMKHIIFNMILLYIKNVNYLNLFRNDYTALYRVWTIALQTFFQRTYFDDLQYWRFPLS